MAGKKVLLIENEKSPLSGLKSCLAGGGFEVTSYSQGFQALQQLGSNGADIVVTASDLDDISGYQLSCLIKGNDSTSALPVLLVSSGGNGDTPFWSQAALADSAVKAEDLDDKDKTVSLVKTLIKNGKDRGWKPSLAKGSRLLPKQGKGDSKGESHDKLFDELIFERLLGRIMRTLATQVDPLNKFTESYFAEISRLFDYQLAGLVLVHTNGPWGAFHALPGLSKKSFGDLLVKLSKQLDLKKEMSLNVKGQLDESGKAINSPEILTINDGKVALGAVIFAARQKKGFGEGAKSQMSLLKNQIEPVLRILRLNQDVESLRQREQYRASTDSLTGLYNLEFFVGFLQQQLLFSYRQRSPVGLAIVDVDNFKSLNDEYGYEVGDVVLSGVANRILHNTRGSDLIARYGGDELAVVLPNTDLNGCKVLSEKIRKDIEQADFVKGKGGKGPKVTVSIGCAAFNMEDLNPETILRDAKLALQRAKEAGHNCISD